MTEIKAKPRVLVVNNKHVIADLGYHFESGRLRMPAAIYAGNDAVELARSRKTRPHHQRRDNTGHERHRGRNPHSGDFCLPAKFFSSLARQPRQTCWKYLAHDATI